MLYFIQAIFEVIATIIAYITNPIVCLFADEHGNLPQCLKYWQTYDNCLDIDWMIYEHNVPKFAEYDFNKHYIYHSSERLSSGIVLKGYVDIVNPDFTIKEKIQRYVCRLTWMYRNCNYGFSYYVNGRDVNVKDLVIVRNIKEFDNEQFICYERNKNIFTSSWCIWYKKSWCKYFKLRIYLGWKLKDYNNGRHMLALFIHPFRKVEK